MHQNIRQSADNRDFNTARLNFRFAFDIDPAFDTYRDDYEYCKKIPGFFEEHRELTPFSSNPADWDENYWDTLKNDLSENFSIKRFDHILEVAKVFHKDKIKNLEAAQSVNKTSAPTQKPIANQASNTDRKINIGGTDTYGQHKTSASTSSNSSATGNRFSGTPHGPLLDRNGNEINDNNEPPKKHGGIVAGVLIAAVVIAAIIVIIVMANKK